MKLVGGSYLATEGIVAVQPVQSTVGETVLWLGTRVVYAAGATVDLPGLTPEEVLAALAVPAPETPL